MNNVRNTPPPVEFVDVYELGTVDSTIPAEWKYVAADKRRATDSCPLCGGAAGVALQPGEQANVHARICEKCERALFAGLPAPSQRRKRRSS
jgi:hypothetical protein